VLTLALLASQAGLLCAQSDSSPKTIKIAEIRFAGIRQLGPSDFQDINRRYLGRTVAASQLKETLEVLTQRVSAVYQQRGYFKIIVKPAIETLSVQEDQRDVGVLLRLEEGKPYRLKEVLWPGKSVFSLGELQATMPISPGEIFDTSKIRKGLENLRRIYGQRGYLNFTAIPDTKIDEITQTITLGMDLDEGKQFRIRKVEFLGLPEDARATLMGDWKLEPGAPYDLAYVEKFFAEHQALLPPGASPYTNYEAPRDEKDGMVDLIWDFSDR
jgi:outer membrane protein insertion porin family